MPTSDSTIEVASEDSCRDRWLEAALRAVKYAAKLVRLIRSSSKGITLISVHDDAGLRQAKALIGSDEVADYFAS